MGGGGGGGVFRTSSEHSNNSCICNTQNNEGLIPAKKLKKLDLSNTQKLYLM